MIVNQAMGLVLPASTKYLIDVVIGKGRTDLLWKIALAAALVMLTGVVFLIAASDANETDTVLAQLHMLKRSSPTIPSHRRIRKAATYDGAAGQHSVRTTSLFFPPANPHLQRVSMTIARATTLASLATCVLIC